MFIEKRQFSIRWPLLTTLGTSFIVLAVIFNHLKITTLTIFMVASLLILVFYLVLKRVEQRIRNDYLTLAHSEKLLKRTLAIAQLGCWELDMETGQWSWSDEMFRILDVEQNLNTPDMNTYLTHVDPQDRERVLKVISQTPTLSQPDFHVEHAVQPADGNRRTVFLLGKTTFNEEGKPIRQEGTIRDVTKFRRMEELSEQSLQSQIFISTLLETGLEKISLKRQLEVALEIILSVPWLTILNKGSIFLYDNATKSLVMAAQRNLAEQLLIACQQVPMGYCLCGRAAQSKEILLSNHLDERHEVSFEGMTNHGHYCVPILHQTRLLGVINLYLAEGHVHESREDSFMATVANTLAGLIEQRRMEEIFDSQKINLSEIAEGNEILKMLLESAMEPVPLQDQLDQLLTMLFYLPWLPIQPKGAILLEGEAPGQLEIKSYSHNFEEVLETQTHFPFGTCLCGDTLTTEMVIHGSESEEKEVHDPERQIFRDFHVCVPVMEEGRMFGAMILYLDDVQHLNEKNRTFLQSVAAILSIIVVKKRQDSQLVQALTDQKLANQKLDRANDFIRKTFGSYMSQEVVENILDTPDGLLLGGEEKIVTVLMTDLRGFTALSERMPPGEVLTMLNLYLGVMTTIIQDYKGTIIEFLGDGILALFGAPITREDDAQRAVACALSMQKAMPEVNLRNKSHGYPELAMGAGINTGSVIAGNIGSEVRRKYGVVGKTINLASRIESLTTGGQVLISENTVRACQELLHIQKQWQENLKGVPYPVTISHVVGMGGPEGIHLSMPEEKPLRPISKVVPVQLTILKDKTISHEGCQGTITAMGLPMVEINTSLQALPHDNVNIILFDDGHEIICDQLYGKTVSRDEDRQSLIIHLTSISPEVEEIFRCIEMGEVLL